MPFLIFSALAAVASLVLLVLYAVIVGLGLGVVLVAKDTRAAPAEYEKDPPVKAWDGLWAWGTFSGVRPALRFYLASASSSVLVIVLAVGLAGEVSSHFAWGVLGASACLGGVEPAMRHRHVRFQYEAAWVVTEAIVLFGVALFARHHAWLLGVGVACAMEVIGFITGLGIAVSRVKPGVSS